MRLKTYIILEAFFMKQYVITYTKLEEKIVFI
jgi:hypothetical protein